MCLLENLEFLLASWIYRCDGVKCVLRGKDRIPHFPIFALTVLYARVHEKIQKGAEKIKTAHRSSLHSVPLAIRLISKPTPRTFQVHTKQNQRIISCFPAWDRMREDWKQKRKQAPEPDGGGACVWILNLSLCSSVNALYHSVQFLPHATGAGWCASRGRRAPGRG